MIRWLLHKAFDAFANSLAHTRDFTATFLNMG